MCRGTENCWHQRRERKRVYAMWDFLFLSLNFVFLLSFDFIHYSFSFFILSPSTICNEQHAWRDSASSSLLFRILLHCYVRCTPWTGPSRSVRVLSSLSFLISFCFSCEKLKILFVFNLVDLVALNLQLAGIVVDNRLRF